MVDRAAAGVRLAYETWGELSPARDNAVLVLHALTGDSHVVGAAGPGHPTPGWWGHLIGPGGLLDTDRWFVVAPNILGGCQGTTGPGSTAPDGRPWGSRFPRLTTRDQVAAEIALADALGIDRWAMMLAGSAGGMRAVEWAVTVPERVERLLLLASTRGRVGGPDRLVSCPGPGDHLGPGVGGWGLPTFPRERRPPGPVGGLAVARQIAHITYRSADELALRFGRADQPGESVAGRWALCGGELSRPPRRQARRPVRRRIVRDLDRGDEQSRRGA